MSEDPRRRIEEEGGQAAFWNKRYENPDYLFGTEPNDFFRIAVPAAQSGQTAFAPADGEGRNGVFLASLGYRVTTLDVSDLAVGKAMKLAGERGVEIDAQVGDVFDWDWPQDAYDLVAVSFMHFLPDQRKRFHASVAGALKPGGLLVLEGFNPDQAGFESGGPPIPEMLFTREILKADFSGLDIFLVQECRRELAEGPRHRGEAATVQLVARKPG